MTLRLGLALALLAGACTPDNSTTSHRNDDETAIFKYNGTTYTKPKLPEELRFKIYQAERRYQQDVEKAVTQHIVDVYLQAEAAKQDKPLSDVRAALTGNAEPSEEELKKFYESVKERVPYSYEMVKEELRKHLKQKNIFEAQNALVDKAKVAGEFALMLPKLKAPPITIDTANRPEKGNPDAKITLIEFADFGCPHCGHAFKAMQSLYPKIKDQVRFVYMDYPLAESGVTSKVSAGGYCAMQQGQFWAYHDLAFTNQSKLNLTSPSKFAKDLDLDLEKFDKCFKSPEATAWVTESREKGTKAGVQSTPTFFLDGVRVETDDNLEALEKAIAAKSNAS